MRTKRILKVQVTGDTQARTCHHIKTRYLLKSVPKIKVPKIKDMFNNGHKWEPQDKDMYGNWQSPGGECGAGEKGVVLHKDYELCQISISCLSLSPNQTEV